VCLGRTQSYAEAHSTLTECMNDNGYQLCTSSYQLQREDSRLVITGAHTTSKRRMCVHILNNATFRSPRDLREVSQPAHAHQVCAVGAVCVFAGPLQRASIRHTFCVASK
jgi:hypothetical protein